MKVILYYGGCKSHDSDLDCELEDVVNYRKIELQRIPNVGESLTLMVGEYHLDMVVAKVYTDYCEPGNPYIKESFWGDEYALYVKDVSIVDLYGEKRIKRYESR